MSDSPKREGQPPVFWIGVGAAILALGLLITRIAMFGGQGGAVALGIAIGIAIVALVIVFFVWNVRSGIRSVAEAFPHAIHIPTTVGSELAAASRRVAQAFGDDDIRMSPSTYAALAIDSEGVHVASDHSAEYGLIPADRITVAGYGRSLLGSRMMTSLVLRVTTADGDLEFAFAPMRLKGNPVKQLKPDEFAELSAELTKALRGEPVSAGWKY
ncbi:MAG TPA: hypothetical protein VL294_02625 [Pseudolysinimonas sp.]|jgi:hypothetical protein|nr:hypothetical protein [Pseudolysinimonas sp.]